MASEYSDFCGCITFPASVVFCDGVNWLISGEAAVTTMAVS